jgi:hypothetical protein
LQATGRDKAALDELREIAAGKGSFTLAARAILARLKPIIVTPAGAFGAVPAHPPDPREHVAGDRDDVALRVDGLAQAGRRDLGAALFRVGEARPDLAGARRPWIVSGRDEAEDPRMRAPGSALLDDGETLGVLDDAREQESGPSCCGVHGAERAEGRRRRGTRTGRAGPSGRRTPLAVHHRGGHSGRLEHVR